MHRFRTEVFWFASLSLIFLGVVLLSSALNFDWPRVLGPSFLFYFLLFGSPFFTITSLVLILASTGQNNVVKYSVILSASLNLVGFTFLFCGFAISGNNLPMLFPLFGLILPLIAGGRLVRRRLVSSMQLVILGNMLLLGVWSTLLVYVVTDYCFMGACV